uniref:Gustatory receptor n=1 Tax=Panagrolaimus sp. PS1159 TaxID=55785 RepID=A0AC35GP20_9BILA
MAVTTTALIPINVGIISVNLPPETVKVIFHAVDAFEAFLILLSYPIVTTVFYVFYRSPLLHRNLVILIINILVEFFVISLSRLFCISGTLIFGREDVDAGLSASSVIFTGPFAAAEMIRLVACTAFIFSCPCSIIERFCATIFLKSYETMRHNRLIGAVIALQWVTASLGVYSFCTGIIKTSILIGIYGVIMFLAFLIYVLLSWINNRRFRLYQQNRKTLCLSERFQLAENLRTQKMLGNLIIVLFVANILCLSAFVVMSYGNGNFLQACLKAIFDYSVVLYTFIFPIISITSIPDLRISYSMWFYRCRRRVFPVSTTKNDDDKINETRKQLKHLKNTNRKQMVFTIDQEMSVYYRTLNAIWSEDIRPERNKHRIRYTPEKYKY